VFSARILAYFENTSQVFPLRQFLTVGATGHSQGIVTATAVAASSDWASFLTQSRNALTTLFRIGLRSQMVFPVTTLPPSILADALSNNEGNPSPMLSIRDLPVNVVNKYVEKTNSHLPEDRKVGISLINGPRGVVVVGPPGSLHGLNLSLRKLKAPQGLEQGRVPHSERKLRFTNRFLPISCPFHSKYLEHVAQTIIDDLDGIIITPKDVTFPVFATDSGKNLQDLPAGTNIVPLLVHMITHLPVHWEQATQFIGATHIIDFGPGGLSGLGSVTHRNKDGTGVRIIIAGSLEGGGGIGGQGEVFERGEAGVRYNVDWVKQYRPRLIKVIPRTYIC
jgi:fatty acid synthase subunit beta, fungi type